MRASIVRNGVAFIFFVTTPIKGCGRYLTGYYRLGWYTLAPSSRRDDYALAASASRFVEPAISLSSLHEEIRPTLMKRFRAPTRVDSRITASLLDLIDRQPDATDAYVGEIDRLERINRFRTGYRCWRRTQPFTWADAPAYLNPRAVAPVATERNVSLTGWWTCVSCGVTFQNRALLKMCIECSSVGTLTPLTSLN
jgi:hypothetical protein